MRTSVTLTAEAHALIRGLMQARGLTCEEAINAAILQGLTPSEERSDFHTPTYDLGRALMPVEHAIRLAGELEDEGRLRRSGLVG